MKRKAAIILFAIFIIVTETCSISLPMPENGSGDSFTYYEIIEQRNFFRPKQNNESIETLNIEKTENKSISKEKDLLLTGVIEIKNGYKAIVENASTNKGYYVKVGEAIEDYYVKKIMLNSIILEKDSEEFELKLQQGYQQPISDKKNKQIKQNVKTMDTETKPDPAETQSIRSNTIQQIRSGIRGKI